MPESPVFKGDLLNRFTMITKFTKVQFFIKYSQTTIFCDFALSTRGERLKIGFIRSRSTGFAKICSMFI